MRPVPHQNCAVASEAATISVIVVSNIIAFVLSLRYLLSWCELLLVEYLSKLGGI